MSNSGVYFITCEFFGRRFIKIGRSTNIQRRRNQLQSGCPFRLHVEHVEAMSDPEATAFEKKLTSTFKNMRKRCEWFNTISDDGITHMMLHWFPYDDEIEAYIEQVKAGDTTSAFKEEEFDHQRLLFC